jgi:hypothetical protein
MRGCVRGCDPTGGFLLRAVLGDRFSKKPILIPRGTPSAVDLELDADACGIPRGFAQGPEQIVIEVADAGILVIEHRHAVREGSVILGDGTAIPGRRAGTAAAVGFAERGCR